MKLNMGCNVNHREGFTNVDKFPGCNPDMVVDLEVFPWPWATESIDEICFSHCLEHLGQQTDVYLKIIQEMYRVCAPGGTVEITVPHPRHDTFLWDPTHVRAITIEGMTMLNRKINEAWMASGDANTPLAVQLGVDFEIIENRYTLDPRYSEMVKTGVMTMAQVQDLAVTANNVIGEIFIRLRAIK